MNSQVLVDRELLERLTADPMGLSNKTAHWAACHELREILDATKMVSPIPNAGERLEVVGYLPVKTFCDDGEELMTVAQHKRIVGALQASAMVVPDGWIAVSDRLPEVPEGEEQEVIVCVKRAHNGESYVFSARYLNAFLLYNDDIDDESTTATGWHDVKEHSEYDGWYSKLIDDGSGDEVTHWMPLDDRLGWEIANEWD